MKIYRGERFDSGCEVYVHENGACYPLPPRNDIVNHSPNGFEWGYSGSGPAQLALAIMADFCGPARPPAQCPFCESAPLDGWKCRECGYDGEKEDRWAYFQSARVHYQDFKFDVVSRLSKERWEIRGEEIEEWIKARILA